VNENLKRTEEKLQGELQNKVVSLREKNERDKYKVLEFKRTK